MKLISNNFTQSLSPETDMLGVLASLKTQTDDRDPFFICKLSEIINRYYEWNIMLPRVKPYYRIKSNSSCIVLETLADLGVGFECTTKNDIRLALSVAHDNPIFVSNKVKTPILVKTAASSGAQMMIFEDEQELEIIKKYHPQANLLLFVRTAYDDDYFIKFGCDPLTEGNHLLQMAKSFNLNVVGVHFEIEPQGKNAAYTNIIELARNMFEFGSSMGYNFNILSLGSGFPPDSLSEISKEINHALEKYFPDDSVNIIANAAQFLVESAYTLSCQIEFIRQVDKVDPKSDTSYKHNEYFINDSVFGSFNNILCNKKNFNIQPLNQYPMSKTYSSSIWGPSGGLLDQIVEEVLLPEMNVGDSIIFDNMGFFTACSNSGFPIQKVYILADDEIWLQVWKDQKQLKEIYFVMGNLTEEMKIQRKLNYSTQLIGPAASTNILEIMQLDSCNVNEIQ